jgi:hypothetical protein
MFAGGLEFSVFLTVKVRVIFDVPGRVAVSV